MGNKHKLPMLHGKPKPRQCGTCVECCVVPEAPYLGKARLERCKHLGESKGCGNYDNRPDECKQFHCMWLLDGLDKELRPDRCGLIVAINLNQFAEAGVPHTVVVWETRPEAADTGDGGRLVEVISRSHAVVINGHDGRLRVSGPGEKVTAVVNALGLKN